MAKDRKHYLEPIYGSRWDTTSVPKTKMAQHAMRPRDAYQIIKDEMSLQGNPLLNLATFVTTWMEPEAEELMQVGNTFNLIDEDEYPQLKIIENRVINMEADLFNAPDNCAPTGVATIGSSEAIMLGLLAHKWTWRKKRKAEGKDIERPNIIFGADVHTCWEKFARYFDVEMKVIPMETNKFTISAEDVAPLIDENTIAIGAVVGTTFTGQIDDVEGINTMLLELKNKTGQDIPIHVDAASGGFVMPFVAPEVRWDFRLEHVRSINVSNHKFGLVYGGLGSVIFKDQSDLPKELPFQINYLGGSMDNYSLNFSKNSGNLIAQYYNFIRYGREGYGLIMDAVMNNARMIENYLVKSGYFSLLTDTKYLPVVVVQLNNSKQYTVYDISDELRKYGWIIPAYSLPANAESVEVLRMVVKENFSHDLAEKLIKDLKTVIQHFEAGRLQPQERKLGTHSSIIKPPHVC
jgi:glutamate decarboxylase